MEEEKTVKEVEEEEKKVEKKEERTGDRATLRL